MVEAEECAERSLWEGRECEQARVGELRSVPIQESPDFKSSREVPPLQCCSPPLGVEEYRPSSLAEHLERGSHTDLAHCLAEELLGDGVSAHDLVKGRVVGPVGDEHVVRLLGGLVGEETVVELDTEEIEEG